MKKREIIKEFEVYFVSIGGGTALNSEEEVVAQKENITNWWLSKLETQKQELLEKIITFVEAESGKSGRKEIIEYLKSLK